jgi:hypothetical protein
VTASCWCCQHTMTSFAMHDHHTASGTIRDAVSSHRTCAHAFRTPGKVDGHFDATWWTVFSPLIAAAATCLYVFAITMTRLRVDSSSRFSRK